MYGVYVYKYLREHVFWPNALRQIQIQTLLSVSPQITVALFRSLILVWKLKNVLTIYFKS